MSAPAELMTYEELRELPDDGNRYELIDGVLTVPPSPSPAHARLTMRLIRILDRYLSPRQLGDYLFTAPLDVRLTQFRAVQPDVLYVNPAQAGAFAAGYVAGAPELVVEVLSPSNRTDDRGTKFHFYAEAGIREYWIVDPDLAAFALHVLTDGRYSERPIEDNIARSVVLPGLEVDLAELFAGLHRGLS